MDISVTEQTADFLLACLFGAVLGLFYDVFRVFRVAVPCSKAAIFLQDLLFWFVCAASTFLFLLCCNAGEIRFFLLLGELLGALLYYFTFGVLVMKSARALVALLRRFFAFLFRLVSAPVRFFARLLSRFVNCMINWMKNLMKTRIKHAKTHLQQRTGKVYNLFIHNKNAKNRVSRRKRTRRKKRRRRRTHEKNKKE